LPRQLLRVLLRWFPQRQFVCAADGNFATHDLARLAAPAVVVKRTKQRTRLGVAWYGGGRREVAVVTGTAHW
jgi:hypothetical protein